MNANISVFDICVAAIIYLLLYNLHNYTFNCFICKKSHIKVCQEYQVFEFNNLVLNVNIFIKRHVNSYGEINSYPS